MKEFKIVFTCTIKANSEEEAIEYANEIDYAIEEAELVSELSEKASGFNYEITEV